jgi:Ca2+-transporting ATPase
LAYWIGLQTHPEASEFARTMAFVTLSFSELLRAYTARSEHYPLLKLGIFTNRSMNWAVISSLVLLLGVVYLPFLNNIFETVALGWAQWQFVLPLLFIPSIAAEVTKWFISRRMIVETA